MKLATGPDVVLHVADVWTDDVRDAVLEFAAASPGHEHHLLRGLAGATGGDVDEDAAAGIVSVTVLPRGGAARRVLRRVLAEVRPDVVHAHGFRAGVLVRAGTRMTARVVVSPHCHGFDRDEAGWLARLGMRVAEGVLARRADAVIASTPHEARTAARLGSRNVVFVPRLARVPALAMFERRQRDRIVGAGRIAAQQDPDFFRSVVLQVRRSGHPALDARWIGEEGDRIARLRLERAGVSVTGWMASFDRHVALGSAGVLLHTARWSAMPAAVLDAIELGVPVIAREVPTSAGANATPRIRTVDEMAAAVRELLTGSDAERAAARDSNLAGWQRLVAGHTRAEQAAALAAAYRSDSRPPILLDGGWLNPASGATRRDAAEVTRRVLELDPAARVVVPAGVVLPHWLPAARVLPSRLRGRAFQRVALRWRGRGTTLVSLAGTTPVLSHDQLAVLPDGVAVRTEPRP